MEKKVIENSGTKKFSRFCKMPAKKLYGNGGIFHALFIGPKVKDCPTNNEHGILEEKKTQLKVFKMQELKWIVKNLSIC